MIARFFYFVTPVPCTMNPYVRKFSEINKMDIPVVGGKNASLGEMFSNLSAKEIKVPNGFATTATAYWEFLKSNRLEDPLQRLMQELDKKEYANLKEIGAKARNLLLNAALPKHVTDAVLDTYREVFGKDDAGVAVRSSATAEDLPQASFAGQHESYLNVRSEKGLMEAIKKCYASLYTNRAIKYREDNGFAHEKIALSVGIQKMVRSDQSCSGVAFTLEPESGFRDIIHLSGVWGLGENLVQGLVTPDEFLLFKPSLRKGNMPIIHKSLGDKEKTMICGDDQSSPTINVLTPLEKRSSFVLNEKEIIQLGHWCLRIEEHYQQPMDIEWAKDGITDEIFIIQARPETVHARKTTALIKEYHLLEKGEVIAAGEAIGNKIASGTARVLHSTQESEKLQWGEILVTDSTSPDWDPILKKAAAIITNKGGRTSHASIVARELGVPAVVGTDDATEKIKDGEPITVSCNEGKKGIIYKNRLKFKESIIDVSSIEKPKTTKAMLILADPGKAFSFSFYPNDGVGLLRIEFIITHAIRIHPMALVRFHEIKDQAIQKQIEALTQQYADKKLFFVEKLAEGIATIAAAFYPKPVIVRMSDFKTNEYANLLGGREFEAVEENPMLGFRGASRYYHPRYEEGFELECRAVSKVRDDMGLTNVKVMIPFCRTVEEGEKVLGVMKKYGLGKGNNKLEVYVMAEIPSNVLLADQFATLFDGFSIGSNDLTQLTLGIDRDSAMISSLFDEQNEAAKEMVATVIRKAKAAGSTIGLCGQAPSDFPEFARFLVMQGIDSISFNPDALIKGIENIRAAEMEKEKAVIGKKATVVYR